MSRWPWAAVGLLLGSVTLLLALPSEAAAQAAQVLLEIQAPAQANIGGRVDVVAVLKDGTGAPVQGVEVTFWSEGSFLSTAGALELGHATTDRQGRASFVYEPRSQGTVALSARFLGDSRYQPAMGSRAIAVQGSTQLYQENAGIRVPGISPWLLAAILGGVWCTYFAVMVLLALIARDTPRPPVAREGRHG